MFIRGRKYLLQVITRMQRQRCVYDMMLLAEPPKFCDCKYGYDESGEQTGCPELRCVSELLKLITDEEYTKIMARRLHINSGD